MDKKFAKQLEKQFERHGEKSIKKSYLSLNKRLIEHQNKVSNLRYKSSVEREITTFKRQIDTIELFMKNKGIR